MPSRVSDSSFGRGEERTRIGRAPMDPNAANGLGRPASSPTANPTSGSAPPPAPGPAGNPASGAAPTPTSGTVPGAPPAIDFSQDGLVPSGTPRTERPRGDNQSGGLFESRPTSDRPRSRGPEGGAQGSDFRPPSDRGQVPTRARDAEGASAGQFGSPPEAGSVPDRTQVPTRARDAEGASSGEFDVPRDLESTPTADRSPTTTTPPTPTRSADGAAASEFDLPDEPNAADESWAPQGSARPQTPDKLKDVSQAKDPSQVHDSGEVTEETLPEGVDGENEKPPELGEPPAQSKGPGRGRGLEGKPGGTFEAPRETPRGPDGRPLPPGEQRLPNALKGGPAAGGTFFDSSPQTRGSGRPGNAGPGGALPGGPGGGLGGVPGGKGDKATNAMFPNLAGILGQQSLAEHFEENLLLLPPRQSSASRSLRIWTMFAAYAEANARNPQGQTPAGRQAFAEVLTANGYANLRDARTGRDGVTVALELLDATSPEELHKLLAQVQMEPSAADHLSSAGQPPPGEEPRAQEQHEARKEAARQQQAQSARKSDPKEQTGERYAATPAQASKSQDVQGNPLLQQQGPLSQRELRQERERRRTNKRMGSNLLWGTLHSLRDSPEDSAVLREKWNQLAFGAIVALVGMGLLVAMLVSL